MFILVRLAIEREAPLESQGTDRTEPAHTETVALSQANPIDRSIRGEGVAHVVEHDPADLRRLDDRELDFEIEQRELVAADGEPLVRRLRIAAVQDALGGAERVQDVAAHRVD